MALLLSVRLAFEIKAEIFVVGFTYLLVLPKQ